MKKQLLNLLCLLIICSLVKADSISESSYTTPPFILDTRTSIGGRILHGAERVSPVAENENKNARLTVDGVSPGKVDSR